MYQNYNQLENVQQRADGLSTYVSKVFGWMFIGLLFTAASAFYVASSETLIYTIIMNKLLFYGLMLGEILLVVYLAGWITKMNYFTAISVFLLYSVLNGVTLSIILLVYTMSSVAETFMITAVTFGVMAVYGYITKTDLTRFGNLLFMGLIGIVITSVVNIFMNSSTLGWVISIVGLFVFLGLTAYDTQKIKGYYYATENNLELRKKIAISGALSLYLDFINLFLTLLRLFGKKR